MTTNTETKQAPPQPTLADVGVLETKAADLGVRADELGEREQQITKQIADIHATGSGGDKKQLSSLTRERREGREERADLLEAAEVLRAQVVRDRKAASRTAAAQRLAEIPKAYTTLVRQYEAGISQLSDAAAEYVEASVTLHQTFGALAKMRAERAALADRFEGVATPNLPPSPIVAPAQHGGVRLAVKTVAINFADHAHIAMATEKDEHGLRSRRSYREAADSPGYDIIKTVGLPPWPKLTTAQAAIRDGRRRDAEAERRDSTRFAAESERILERRGV